MVIFWIAMPIDLQVGTSVSEEHIGLNMEMVCPPEMLGPTHKSTQCRRPPQKSSPS
jgi:hypothetical protein